MTHPRSPLFALSWLLPLALVAAMGPIQDAIESGAAASYDKEKCIWRQENNPNLCPDEDIYLYLYTPGRPRKLLIDLERTDWLRQDYDPSKENVLLIHGYAGGDDTLPIAILRDAYLRNGSYNVFLVDWGTLCAPPCYPAAVTNMRPVAKCVASFLTNLRNIGLPIERTTCVGHSLGAHVCGIMANFLLFRMHRIIGLDPARPLVKISLVNRLDVGDANFVEAIHTNAGYYGAFRRVGHVDFCVNGGKMQPFCENTKNNNLCSHLWAGCFMAQSIDDSRDGTSMMAESCSRRCPSGPKIAPRYGKYITMGQHTPIDTRGSFCYNKPDPPYCPKYWNGRGDERCCITGKETESEQIDKAGRAVLNWRKF